MKNQFAVWELLTKYLGSSTNETNVSVNQITPVTSNNLTPPYKGTDNRYRKYTSNSDPTIFFQYLAILLTIPGNNI